LGGNRRSAALLQLYERGKLDLDAPVQKYCPAFPHRDSPITSRQLLAHLGGIRHYNKDGKGDVPDDSARHVATMEESLQLFASDPLVAKPGTQFHYPTYATPCSAASLEGAASQKYTDFVRENVFRPAAMDHTQADDFFAIVPHRTRWYHRDKTGAIRNASVLDSSYKFPALASSPTITAKSARDFSSASDFHENRSKVPRPALPSGSQPESL